jgi:hypothetical protein
MYSKLSLLRRSTISNRMRRNLLCQLKTPNTDSNNVESSISSFNVLNNENEHQK